MCDHGSLLILDGTVELFSAIQPSFSQFARVEIYFGVFVLRLPEMTAEIGARAFTSLGCS